MERSTIKKLYVGVSSLAAAAMLLAGCSSNSTASSTSASSTSGSSPSSSSSSASASSTSSSSAPTVKIIVGGLEKIIYMPYMLTQQLGYYKDEGLNVQLVEETAGNDAETALLANEVDGVGGFYDHTLDLATKGKTIEDVVTMADVPGETLLVSNKLKGKVNSVSDLKGLKIGVTDLGSSTNMLATYNVVRGGGTASSYTPVPVGAGDTLIAAMKNGQIDAAVTSEPTASLLKSEKLAYTLVDMNHKQQAYQVFGGTGYAATSLYMEASYVQAHPDIVQKLANAYVKTLKWMSTHTPEQIADKMPSAYYAGNKQLYIEALKGQLPMFTPDGIMPKGEPENVQKIMSSFNPAAKSIDISKTYTNEFVDKANN